jgi:hypothetical protein
MELQSKLIAPVAKSVFGTLKDAYQYRQQLRVEDFLKSINVCYETMTLESQSELNEHIESEIGQEVLAEFADAILHTSSRKVRMAVALLYCKDPEFQFTSVDLHIFLGAMDGITEDLIDFFLMATKLECQSEHIPYPRSAIHNKNCHAFFEKGWEEETIFVYVHDLIRRRLLLPDSDNNQATAASGEGWAVWFGITSKTRKLVSLLEKAEGLLSNET